MQSRRPLRGRGSHRRRIERRSRRPARTAVTRVDRPREKVAVAEPLDRPCPGGAVVDDPALGSLILRCPFHDAPLVVLRRTGCAAAWKVLRRPRCTMGGILQATWIASNPARVNRAPLRCDAGRSGSPDMRAYTSKVSGRRSPCRRRWIPPLKEGTRARSPYSSSRVTTLRISSSAPSCLRIPATGPYGP